MACLARITPEKGGAQRIGVAISYQLSAISQESIVGASKGNGDEVLSFVANGHD
jgi:hypothetical protein